LTRGSSNASTSFTRLNRRNQATQRKLKKRGELEELGQLFSRKGEEKVARVVAVVPMTGDVVASQVVEQLLAAVGVVGTGEHGMRTAE
jgi:ClpP class serine protease